MPNGVLCSVSNCSFWNEGNRCGAQEIAIEIDAHARLNAESEEFADEFGEEHQDTARTSAVTCCLTFKPKSEG
ncbi:DUF1540 domain-containing protein [Cohnella massiliensis]|uniref:DUF1540 domain-containing protein n=1 Tax=Cohnella massiliensis TaxID=1816691 RepID=UPI0009BC325B|nr:DUF1540 domain-containing protein [Cohnella massiliensis]